jgi:hypothetical protein
MLNLLATAMTMGLSTSHHYARRRNSRICMELIQYPTQLFQFSGTQVVVRDIVLKRVIDKR